MAREMQVSDSVVIDVDAATIWAQVADPAQMPRWSPENTGATTPLVRGRVASWAYDFEPVDGGTRVTETWTDARKRWPDWTAAAFDRTVTGGKLFSDFQRRNIRRTLATMKTEFESGDRTT